MKGLYFLKLCRWCLILIGLVMLVSVLFIMGQLLVDWGNGRAGGNLGIGLASSTTDSGLVYTLSQIRQVNLLILYYTLINRIVNMQVAASCRSKAFLCAFQLFILKHCFINLPLQAIFLQKYITLIFRCGERYNTINNANLVQCRKMPEEEEQQTKNLSTKGLKNITL